VSDMTAAQKRRSTQAADDSLSRYLDEIGRHPLLTRAEEVRLARRAAAGDAWARQRLAESNLRLVVAVARRYRGLGLDMLDLIQEGNLGLLDAVERYDWRREAKFSSYAVWWIRRAITRALSTKSRVIRLPIRLAAQATAINRTEERLTQTLGRPPSCSEVASAAGVDARWVEELRRTSSVASLSAPVGQGDETTLEDLIGAEGEVDLAGELGAEDEQGTLVRALSSLGERSRRVVELRFGIDGDRQSLDDVARELGISRERVRRIEAAALKQLLAHPALAQLRAAA